MTAVNDDNDEVLLKVERVSKKFCLSLKRSLWYGAKDVAGALIPWNHGRAGRPTDAGNGELPPLRVDEFWAVKDVSFEVRRGECLGLIGHNGAGKSTLLKILNGLINPDAGRITIRGRVGALIELNAGFNPILSGRENIYNEGALLGFSKEEIESRFDDIVRFAELEEFLDMPVQNYSSGMRVRLGFAVAAQLEPDILLIDEVLAVGDVGFRAKCLGRMGELRDRCAFIFVSHSMPQIARISTEVLHLHRGETLLHTRNLSDGLVSYYSTFEGEARSVHGNGLVKLASIRRRIDNVVIEHDESIKVDHGETLEFEIVCEFLGEVSAATLQLVVWNQEMIPVMDVLGPNLKRWTIEPGLERRCVTRVQLPPMTFSAGRFSMTVVVLSLDGLTTLCQIDRAQEFEVTSNVGSACTLSVVAKWLNMDSPREESRPAKPNL